MKVLVLSLLTAFFGLFTSHQTAYTKMVDRVSSSVVRIIAVKDDGLHTCSGEVIGVNLVLTAAHCVGDTMSVDGIPAKVLKGDAYFDLLLLSVPTTKPAIRFRSSNVVRYEDLTAIGYAFGWTKLSVLQVRAYLLNIDPFDSENAKAPGIVTQGAFIPGMSGGPVVDADGEMVSMAQQANGGVGFGVGVQLIKAFLLGAVE